MRSTGILGAVVGRRCPFSVTPLLASGAEDLREITALKALVEASPISRLRKNS
jgi:hypothetical protein